MQELHFQLIVHDASAMDQLHLVAAELIEKARRTNEPRKAYACLLAYERLLAVAHVHEHLQAFKEGDKDAGDAVRDACSAMMDCFPEARDDDAARRARFLLPAVDRPALPRFLQAATRAEPPETIGLVMRHEEAGGWSIVPGVALAPSRLELRPWVRNLGAWMRAAFGFARPATTS